MYASNLLHKREDFGTVNFQRPNFRRRRRNKARDSDEQPQPNHAQLQQSSSFQKPKSHAKPDHSEMNLTYKYNTATAKLLIPSLLAAYGVHHSPIPLMVTLYAILILYGLDLCGSRDSVSFGIWVAFGMVMISFVWEHYRWIYDDSWGALGLFFHVAIIFCLCCWATLQMQWLYCDALYYAKSVEGLLHTILPLAAAVVISHFAANRIGLVNLSPYIYAIVLYVGIYFVGKTLSSYIPPPPKQSQGILRSDHIEDEESKYCRKKVDHISGPQYSISRECSHMLALCLQFTPTILYVWQRIRGSLDRDMTFMQDLCSASSLLSVSYLLSLLLQYQRISWWQEPKRGHLHEREVSLSAFIAVIGFVAFQYRYLVPISLAVSHHFHGRQTQELWQICLSFNSGILGIIGTGWVSMRRNIEGERILGAAHYELCTVMALLSLFSVGTSFPLPYGVILVSVVSIMSITMFAITKLFRFMAVSVIVNGAGMAMLLYLQYSHIKHEVVIIPGVLKMSLLGFSMLPIAAGACIMFAYSAASLKFPREITRRDPTAFNATSTMLIIYTFFLFFIESALYHDKGETISDEEKYSKTLIISTSAILGVTVLWLRHLEVVGSFSVVTIVSALLSKAVAAIIEIQSLDDIMKDHQKFLLDALVCMAFCWTISAPYFILHPFQVGVHRSTSRHAGGRSSSYSNNDMVIYVNGEARYPYVAVVVYCGILLPCLLAVTVSRVFLPLIARLFQDQNISNPSLQSSDTLGYSLLLWGLFVLFILRYFSPEGGFQSWRKCAAVSSIIGTLIVFFAPALPFTRTTSENPYLLMSSLSNVMVKEFKGVWGLMSLSLAVLLAPSKQSLQGKMRAIVFSSMFGCGMSYFLVSQLSENLSAKKSAYVLISSSLSAFVQTYSSVEVYTTELTPKTIRFICTGTTFSLCSVVFMVILECTMSGKLKGFELGSPPAIQLFTMVPFLLLIAFAAKMSKKNDSQMKQLQNTYTFLAWIAALLAIYGSFGLASVGVHSKMKMLLGVPSSLLLTIIASLLLYNFDLGDRKARTSSMQRPTKNHQIVPFAFCLFGSLTVYLIATFYAITMRGMTRAVPTSHADFFHESTNAAAHLADTFMTHTDIIAYASKLTACNLWTSNNLFVPLKHFIGLAIGPLNAWVSATALIFDKHIPVPHSNDVWSMICNVLVLITCRGIPSLSAASCLCIIFSCYQFFSTRKKNWNSKMSI